MRILCFGDSFTYGYGMPDTDDKGPPSLLAYPQLLAHEFNCSVLNLASPGASNKEIWNIMLQTQYCPSDIVSIMWSLPARTCIITTPQEDPETSDKWRIAEHVSGGFWNKHQTSLGPWMAEPDSGSDSCLMELATAYYKNVHNDVDADISTQLYMSHIDLYLKSIGIKTVIHSLIPHESIKPLFWNKDKKILKFIPKDAVADGHAGPESHKEFAKIVSKYIKKNT